MSDSSSITSTTSASGTNRVTGLYSGMDINSMVSASLTSEQNKIDKMQQNIDYAEWQKEAYQKVNTLITDFQEKYFNYSGEFSLLTSSNLNAKTVTVTGSSAVSISASSSASVDSFSVLSATAATTAKTVTKYGIDGLDFSQFDQIDEATGEVKKAATANNITIAQLAETLNIDLTNLKTVTNTVEKTDADGNVTSSEVTKNYITMTITGSDGEAKTVDIDIDGTITDMMASVNNANAGVKMTYNGFSGKLELKATSSGADGNFTISGDDGLLFGANGMFGESSVATTNGGDASLTIQDSNGDVKTYTSATNSITKAGFTFTINEDFDSAADGEIKAQLGTDTDAIVDKIKSFVSDYNAIVKTLNESISEKRDYDYDPLTEAERKELDDDEIEKYEAKAKEGLLFGDNNIRRLLSNMRSALNSIETETGLSLRDIGIGTGSYFGESKNGELIIDEDKLRSSIESNADEVVSLFTKASYQTGNTTTSGIAGAMRQLTKNYTSTLEDVTISSISKKISNYEDRLETLEDLFAEKEDQLYSEFAYLETLLSQMDATSSMFYM